MIDNNLKYRKDNRTIEEFKQDIFIRTKREKVLMNTWIKIANLNGLNLNCEDAGADNSGQVIFDSAKTTRFPDFLVSGDINSYFDVKVSPSEHCVTFKKDDIKYFKNFNEKVVWLVFFDTGMLGIDTNPKKTTKWILLKQDGIDQVIEYANFKANGHSGFGGKPSYRLFKEDIAKLFKINNLYKSGPKK